MFQFTRFPSIRYGLAYGWQRSSLPGFPIQISPDQWIFAPPRSFSQLITSFIGSQCQGIHPALFFAWPVIRCIALHHMGLGFYRIHKCLLNFYYSLGCYLLKDNFLGCLYRHGYNLLIEPFDILYFPYAIFKVQCKIKIETAWNACIPKHVLIFDFIVCLHMIGQTCLRDALYRYILTEDLSVI